jgi:hypothetical protein
VPALSSIEQRILRVREHRVLLDADLECVFEMFVASAHRASLASAPGSSAWKIGSSGECADDGALALDDSQDSQESFR